MGNESLFTMMMVLAGVLILGMITGAVIVFQKVIKTIKLKGNFKVLRDNTHRRELSSVKVKH